MALIWPLGRVACRSVSVAFVGAKKFSNEGIVVFSRLREECRKGYCYEEVPGELHTIMRIIENKHSQRMLS